MKTAKLMLLLGLLFSCSSTRIIESWQHPDYSSLETNNILLIGVTPNLEARTAFESQLKDAFYIRNIKALQSTIVFEDAFQDSKQTEKEIEEQISKLTSKGYDTVLVSTVKGVDEKTSYSSDSGKTDYGLRKFKAYYLLYQDVYFDADYYSNYKVYHIETAIYNIKGRDKKSLIWIGSYDIVDPQDPIKTTDKFVKTLLKSLEKADLIPRKPRNY